MDRADYVHKRKAKYMAQVLEAFEQSIQPFVPDRGAVQDFKGLVRARMNALAVDAVDIMALGDTAAQNGLAMELKDRLHPTGRP